MTTECYAMVRGSSVRVTGLGSSGEVPHPFLSAVSKSVANVRVNEVTETGSHETLDVDGADDSTRIVLRRNSETIRYTVEVSFLRVDPGVLGIVAGVPVVTNANGDVVGFDSDTRRPAAAFALEVWSRLAGAACEDGQRRYGYTVFPFLKGGQLSGFAFGDGLVSFNLIGAQARRIPRWGVGPYDLEGPYQRLLQVVSGNLMFKQFVTTATPPAQTDGAQELTDVIDGGTAVLV